mmetsp:Transcript_8866/g.15141  ORF Transcript_8866/g.15141 Transcript_8866/m.15141 type:complete len:237 (+) Transcript_8866:334-1044(+)
MSLPPRMTCRGRSSSARCVSWAGRGLAIIRVILSAASVASPIFPPIVSQLVVQILLARTVLSPPVLRPLAAVAPAAPIAPPIILSCAPLLASAVPTGPTLPSVPTSRPSVVAPTAAPAIGPGMPLAFGTALAAAPGRRSFNLLLILRHAICGHLGICWRHRRNCWSDRALRSSPQLILSMGEGATNSKRACSLCEVYAQARLVETLTLLPHHLCTYVGKILDLIHRYGRPAWHECC